MALRAWLGIVQAQRHAGNSSSGHLDKEALYLAARPKPAVPSVPRAWLGSVCAEDLSHLSSVVGTAALMK